MLDTDARMGEIRALLGGLAEPEQRQGAADALAHALGAGALLLFAPDPEQGAPLPAPGLPQVLEGAARWGEFLEACRARGECAGELPGPDGRDVPAAGCALEDGTAAVLLRPSPDGPGVAPLRPLLPLLGALFRSERQVVAMDVRARSAADAVGRVLLLNRTLQQLRDRLEAALVEAREARDEAERARAAADAANRAKSEFLANMSHELRTPINAVIGYADLLNLGIAGPVTGKQRTQLERIRVSSAHLLSLVNDILDLAKVEAGRMTVAHERLPVAEVVREAVALVEASAAERSIELRCEPAPAGTTYVGDRGRVRQILENLLSNAVKFTEPGGTVSVCHGTASRVEGTDPPGTEGPWTWVEVEDTGIGIGEDELPRIFHPFEQVESGRTRAHGGTGLGLTLSRQLARLMGGELTVRSRKGEGSRFRLWLPATDPASRPIDPGIRVGAAGPEPAWPEGLEAVGARLEAGIPRVVASHAEHLLRDPELGAVSPEQVDEYLDQVPVLLSEMARLLIRLGRSRGYPSVARRRGEIRRLIAEELGADRGRRGWTEDALRREFALLRGELERMVRSCPASDPPIDAEGVGAVIDRFLRQAEAASLRSLRAAAVVTGLSNPG